MRNVFSGMVLAGAVALASCAQPPGSPSVPPGFEPGVVQTAVGASTLGTHRPLYRFKGNTDGLRPAGGLLAFRGLLYGTTIGGGVLASGRPAHGTIYSIDPSTGKESVVYRFAGGADGSNPEGNLLAFGGMLYGTTEIGGGPGCKRLGCGTVFAFDPSSGSERVLHRFTGTDGRFPEAGLIVANGTLYGTASAGGVRHGAGCFLGCGTVFAVDPGTGATSVVHAFSGAPDGSLPMAPLLDVAGTLYGTTEEGGDPYGCDDWRSCGTVFAIDVASGQERIVYSFEGGIDAESPLSGLTLARGRLYGTTSAGGSVGKCQYLSACGTVYSILLRSGLERVVYRFANSSDGSVPQAPLLAADGVLYGTTSQGGRPGISYGTIFSIDMASRQERVLYLFPASGTNSRTAARGAYPVAGLTLFQGTLFGTTLNGGAYRCSQQGCGTVFSISLGSANP
jgi:uncharacterized repeat protein (TIGR03803 family)